MRAAEDVIVGPAVAVELFPLAFVDLRSAAF
jgi:hypothetical protein